MTNLFYNHAANGDEAYLESVRKTHEIGFDVMDALADKYNISISTAPRDRA